MDIQGNLSLRTFFQVMKLVATSLNKKYSNSFYFFTTKFINQMICSIGSPLSIVFQDIKTYYDDIQYLRRMYRIKTLDGKMQMEDRIKVVSKYYLQNDMLTYQMPMMFITKTKQLFLRRQKRLKKLKQKQEQSSQQIKTSSFGGGGSLSFSQEQDYLKQLRINLSQLMISQQSSFNINDQIDSDCHNIYQIQEQQESQLLQINLNKQESVNHLIFDFQDVDMQAILNFYNQIKKSKSGSILMNQIIQEQYRSSGRNSQKYKQNSLVSLQLPTKSNKLSSKNDSKNSFGKPKQNIMSQYLSVFGPKSKSKGHQRYLSTNDNYFKKILNLINLRIKNKKFKVNTSKFIKIQNQKANKMQNNRSKIQNNK